MRYPLLSALAALVLLAGCGFKPQYAKDSTTAAAVDLSSVAVTVIGSTITANAPSTISRRSSELLKAEIEDQTNPRGTQGQKQFLLSINYTEQDTSLFVNPDGTSSRGDLQYASSYTLTRMSDGKVIASGNIQRSSSYSASPTADYASYVSVEDARKKGMLALAQDYKLRLATLLPTLNSTNGTSIAPVMESPRMPALPQPTRAHETIYPRY
jgi:LPS-assembly lipoprotein